MVYRACQVFCLLLLTMPGGAQTAQTPARPNVILIVTDDQGYGDIAAHGNTLIQTPNIDKLHGESIRLTDFHVDPTCSPTRSSLMSGRFSTRTGVWHTINGRSLMSPDEYTLAEAFRDGGYRTGMFGKWHLGDNAPLRPMDQGFEHAVWHKGGGVTQGPDYFGNDYFDDTYFVDQTPKAFEGYCTDVWFRQAIRYIDEEDERPFFVYLATNAPHGPYLVAPQYAEGYQKLGLPDNLSKFYGMVQNIDENLGDLRAFLAERGLAENTLLIYMTDNGSAGGEMTNDPRAFNAHMRGHKGSAYDGGHRVPCYWHWPAHGWDRGRDLAALTAHIDVLPTLSAICDLPRPADAPPIDGLSLVPALEGRADDTGDDRMLFVHSQRIDPPVKGRTCAVMTSRWRLVNLKELYDIHADPTQRTDVAGQHPQIVAQLQAGFDQWWDSLTPVFDDVVRIDLGGAENPTTLMSHDWLMPGDKPAAWHQQHVRNNALINGAWQVNVRQSGRYRVTLMRWPDYLNQPAGAVNVRLQIGDIQALRDTDPADPAYTFDLQLPAGPTTLQSWLTREDGKSFGAYFVKVQRLGDE